MKKFLCALSIMVMSLLASMTAYAGQWREEAGSNGAQWRYENNDGTYAAAGWFWLDGNGDGIAECYYFDPNGWMLSNTVTPDGYQVNEDGAWTESGIVRTQAAPQTPETQTEGEQTMIPVTITAGGRQFEASLLNNASTQALIAQMPMTVSMGEMNGNEKYYYLSSSLPTDTRSVGNIHTGDLMLYGSDCLVLFYEDFRTSYRYTRLGAVSNPEGLSEALGRGSVSVTFERK
ncbi:cyclophilin-like fold protein [Clostridium transplantifaecale]|uniref:cyclophilin-like fold protein n=1 Tax=Clostridium transplantifaecale TaxID=2479838 RepID=UPI001FA9AD8F|nr:cyclophilin-like fold protein [Clostridium transplantifaecale]